MSTTSTASYHPRTPAEVIDPSRRDALIDAVQTYFDLMYDCDTSRFDVVFSENAHLHGFRDGVMVSWSAPAYRGVLDARRSPKSLGSPRLEEILMMDFASPAQAFVKVRVRIVDAVFVDYLTWHWISERWRVTSKGFQHEPNYPLGASSKLRDGVHAEGRVAACPA